MLSTFEDLNNNLKKQNHEISVIEEKPGILDIPDDFVELSFTRGEIQDLSKKVSRIAASRLPQKVNAILPNNQDLLSFGEKYVTLCLEDGPENLYSKCKNEKNANTAWYNSQFYNCHACKFRTESEILFVKHILTLQHETKSEKMDTETAAKNLGRNQFYSCPPCATYWYGKQGSFDYHRQNFYHHFFQSNHLNSYKLPEVVKSFLKEAQEVIEELRAESDEIEEEDYDNIIAIIKESIKSIICPNSEAFIYGSRLSLTAFPDSDLNIFLDLKNDSYTLASQKKIYLKNISQILEKKYNEWIIEELALDCEIPILKIRYIPLGLTCDISLTNALDVEKSLLIRKFTENSPICQDLILFLKKWSIFTRMSDIISNYAISWMVIFYLQVKHQFQSVTEFLAKGSLSKSVSGWQCGFNDNSPVKNILFEVEVLLDGFFLFYANFDFRTSVICPLLGKVIKKKIFTNLNELPEEMEVYKNRRLYQRGSEIFAFDSPMCLQDPIQLSQNITNKVKKTQLNCFKQCCFESALKVGYGDDAHVEHHDEEDSSYCLKESV